MSAPMQDHEAFELLSLIPDGEDGLALVLAAFTERAKQKGDLNAIHRVKDKALAICQQRRVGG